MLSLISRGTKYIRQSVRRYKLSHDEINLPKTHYYMVRLIYLENIAYKFEDLNNYGLGLGVFLRPKFCQVFIKNMKS